MFIELIATITAAFAGAGLVMAINIITGRRLPKWLMPVAAGGAMIGVTIVNEYGWYERTQAQLPEGVEVVQQVESKAIYRPWTYLRPFVTRFVAVDMTSIEPHPARPSLRRADSYYYGRWSPEIGIKVLADCAAGKRAALTGGESVAEDGSVANVQWVAAEEGDALMKVICREE